MDKKNEAHDLNYGGDRRHRTTLRNSTLRAIYWLLMIILGLMMYVTWSVYELRMEVNDPRPAGPGNMQQFTG